MFSVSPAEILTIAVVALLVFGPRRLPEIARKAGSLLRELRGAADELKAGLEAEYRETVEPLMDIRDSMQEAISGAGGRRTRPAPDPQGPEQEPAADDGDPPDPADAGGVEAGPEPGAGG